MHPSKTLLTYVIFIAFVATICQLSRIHGELKIVALFGSESGSTSRCLLKSQNETDIRSSITVYGSMSMPCDLQINTSSSSSQVGISVVAGNIKGLNYMYVERIKPLSECPDPFVAFMKPLEPCTAYFAIDTIQLHFWGEIVLDIHDAMVDKHRLPRCPEDVSNEDSVDALKGQTLNCKQVKGFSSVIQCVGINQEWWEYNEFGYAERTTLLSTRCDVQCPDNCSCILSDRQVIYNCPKSIQHLGRNYSSFVLFSSDISHLDLTRNCITVLMENTFINIGNNIRYLDLSHNSLSSLQKGVFTNMQILAQLLLFNNSLTTLNPGIFDHLHSLLSLDCWMNKLNTVDKNLFTNLSNLHKLYLNHNALITFSSEVFHKLHVLKYLFLSDNQIKHFEDDTFSNLSKLTHLSLAHNHLSVLQIDLFNGLLSLTYLDLSHNTLQSISRISHMIPLRRIDLLGNPLTKITQNTFSGISFSNTASVYVDKPEICFCYFNSSNTCFYTTKPSPYLTCNWLLSLPVLTLFIWIIGCSALLGNAFVLWWKQFKHKDINIVQSLLLRNLAMSDLLMGVYMIIIASANVYYRQYFPVNAENWRSGIICRFAGTLAITSSEASVLFVTFISVDRFITIRFPYSLHKLNVKSTKIISSIIWTFSLTLSLVASISAGWNSDFYDNSHVCIGLPLAQVIVTETNTREITNLNFWEDAITVQVVKNTHGRSGLYFSVAVFIAFNMLCFLLILACYIGIIRAVAQTSEAASRQREMSEEIRMTIKVSAIVLTDFCCWFPICLIGVLVQLGLLVLPNSVFAWVVTLVLPINSAINPFLYTLVTIISVKCSKEKSVSSSSPVY